MVASFRRIVTGHDDAGVAVIQEVGPPPRIHQMAGDGAIFYEIWNTRESPAAIDAASGEPPESGVVLAPPKNGTRIRIIDIPPESESLRQMSADDAKAHFSELGAAGASSHAGAASRYALMHRTETVDYGIVLEGELVLILDRDEMIVRAGDVVIQRGTNHGWANRSGANCRIAFILIDGRYDPALGIAE